MWKPMFEKDSAVMTRTDRLHLQHDVAEQLVARIVAQMDHFEGRNDAYRISVNLAKLLGVLRVHLAQEDLYLYPAMMKSDDEVAATLARRFADEMGDLAEQFEQFATCWSASAAIVGRIEQFRAEARAIFGALTIRIARENDELYPLAKTLLETEIRLAS